MSNPLKERGDRSPGGSPIQENASSSSSDDSSNDGDTIRGGDADNDAVSIAIEEEGASTPVGIGNGSVVDRYRQLLQDGGEQSSDSGSIDNIPRRVGSPIGSLLSIPDDASVQVSAPSFLTGNM